MPKQVAYDWGELKIKVEEVPVFDTKNNKYITSLTSVRIEEIDFEKLINEAIKRHPNMEVHLTIKFSNKW